MPLKSYIRTFLENLDDIVFIIDFPSMTYKYISPSVSKRGYTPEEIYADPTVMFQGMNNEQLAEKLRGIWEQIKKGPLTVEYQQKTRSGELRWYSTSMFLVNRSADRQMLGGIVRDITASKTTEKALEALNLKHEDFYNHAPNGYHSLDENGRLVRINDTELKWLGYERKEVIGVHFAEKMLTKESQETFMVNFPKLKEQGFLRELQMDVVRKDGSVFPCLVNATILTDASTGVFLTNSILTDITELKNKKAKLRQSQQDLQALNDELLEANKKLDRLNFTKDVLLKIVSHDIRNPLQTISLISGLLHERYVELDSETIKKYLNYINETSEQANHILEDMVGLVNLDESSADFRFVKTTLVPIIQQALSFNLKKAADKGIRLHVEDNPELHEFLVNVDARWMVRGVDNLISNAIKFSEEGGVVNIKCQVSADKVIIQVSDDGIGIPDSILQNLFKRIAVQSRNGTKGETGTGLGLSIVKQILDTQQGEISVESSEGKGSTFEIRLPRAKV